MADDAQGVSQAPTLRFRNYQPRSEELQSLGIEKAAVAPPAEEPFTEVVHNDPTQEPLLNLAPKRPNWDLKRDLEPQMKRLRAMTDRAIVRLIAARVAEEQASDEAGGKEGGEKVDLATAVDTQQRLDAADDDV